jgi:predicted protein tyrosine phosphatase
VETASAGLKHEAEVPLTPELLEWADLILVMEPVQRKLVSARFAPYLKDKRVACLGIPDRYRFMEPALIERMQRVVPAYLPQR